MLPTSHFFLRTDKFKTTLKNKYILNFRPEHEKTIFDNFQYSTNIILTYTVKPEFKVD